MKKLLVTVIVFLLAWNCFLTYKILNLPENTTKSENTTVNKVVTDFSTDITKVVEESEDKVVTISSYYQSRGLGTGSGAVYKVEGNDVFIITNHHVVEGGNDIVITFANGKETKAEVLGSDAFSDIALLKTKTDFKVNPFKIGDSSLVKKGSNVLAMGSPLGIEYQGSVSSGIVSGVDRNVGVDLNKDGVEDWDMQVFQIDAAINPGNSGGPLINMAGELIGINSMKIASTNVEGFGFSIPINEVIPLVEQMEEKGKVIRPSIGITARDIATFSIYERSYLQIDEDVTQGLFILDVVKNGPADKIGIQSYDIIVAFDGKEINSFKEFRRNLYSKKVGDKVKITILRDGKEIKKQIILE